jgi:hypothetical protein
MPSASCLTTRRADVTASAPTGSRR